VTLGEVYQFAFRRTLASTAASLAGGQHPTYDYRMSGAGDVILARTRPNDARLVFPREAGATYTVMHRERGEVIAELPSTSGDDIYLALPAGDYRVVRRALASVSEQTFALAAGSSTVIESAAMTPVQGDEDTHRKKGGLWQPNALGVHVGMQNSPVSGADSMVGVAALSYMRQFGWLALRARGEISSFNETLQGQRSSFLRTGLWVDALLALRAGGRWAFLIGPSVGAPVVRQTGSVVEQQEKSPQSSYSLGLSYGGSVSAMFRTYGSTWLALTAQGGGEYFRLNDQRVQRGVAGLSLGGLVAF
jgi:hypothetical protein